MKLLEVIRGLVRPFFAANVVGWVWYLLIQGKIDEKAILGILGSIVGFYFAERAINKALSRKENTQ